MLLTGLHTLHISTETVRSVATAHVRALGRAAYFGHGDQKSMQLSLAYVRATGRSSYFAYFSDLLLNFFYGQLLPNMYSLPRAGYVCVFSFSLYVQKSMKSMQSMQDGL